MIPVREVPENDAVSWAGTRFGLVPSLSEEAARIEAAGQPVVPVLREALNDPDRFVTAHVLLTLIAGLKHESFPSWNGLAVELPATGSASVEPCQRETLARRWDLYFASEAPPETLPPAD